MKIAAFAAVVLFCTAVPATTADAGGFLRSRRSAVNVNVGSGVPFSVNVQNQRCGLFGRRCSVPVNVQVGSSFVPSVSSFQFVQPASFAISQPILSAYTGGYAGYSGYSGYSDDRSLADRIRQEAAETAELKDAIGALLQRMNQPVTAP